MKDIDKAIQLQQHKKLATGLFLLMLLVYILMVFLTHNTAAAWVGYVKAFAEAAMVGALADWFAVTALFHHPLGLAIPHTNLIENSKKNIGDNLGNFVVSNFLTAANIRPYIKKLTVSAYAAQWLGKENNKQLLVNESTRLLTDIIKKLDNETIVNFMAKKASGLLDEIKLNKIVANGLQYFLDKNETEKLVTLLAEKVKGYITENEALVKEKVKKESYFFIPKFIDNTLAEKISKGLATYFNEIENDKDHPIRKELSQQLYLFADKLRNEPKWENEFKQLKSGLLSNDKLVGYANDIWISLKATLEEELATKDSLLLKYLVKSIDDLAFSLNTDTVLQQKIDGWIQHNAYKYILRNAEKVGTLISDTVGNWKGKELSQKLELEVGKDLQFIRINGTIVGGLVGLFIYVITQLIS